MTWSGARPTPPYAAPHFGGVGLANANFGDALLPADFSSPMAQGHASPGRVQTSAQPAFSSLTPTATPQHDAEDQLLLPPATIRSWCFRFCWSADLLVPHGAQAYWHRPWLD